MIISDEYLRALLRDDCPCGDLTTEALGFGDTPAQLSFRARSRMTVCCSEEAARMFAMLGADSRVVTPSGQTVEAGTLLLEAAASAAALHQAWKVAQTLMEACSGIASAAHAMNEALLKAGWQTPVACTRKNFPGTKELAIKAIKAGGATVHRLGLSETILLFPEHLMFLHQTPAETVTHLHARLPEKKIVVEVKDAASALEWSKAGADVLQFDKFTPVAFRECLQQITTSLPAPYPKFAAAGGVNARNAAEYAAAGADFLVTSAPYSAPPADVQVDFHLSSRQP